MIEVFNSTLNKQAAAALGVVAYYAGAPASGTVLLDHAYGRNGEFIAGPTFGVNPMTGLPSVVFDGTDDYVSLGTTTVLNFTGPYSVCCWHLGANSGRYKAVVTREGDTDAGYYLLSDNGTLMVGHNRGAAEFIGAVSIVGWHHLAMTYDGTTLTGYVDGVADPSGAASAPTTSATTAAIGRTFAPWAGSKGYYSSATSGVSFHNRALSPVEVKRMYLHPFLLAPTASRRVSYTAAAPAGVFAPYYYREHIARYAG